MASTRTKSPNKSHQDEPTIQEAPKGARGPVLLLEPVWVAPRKKGLFLPGVLLPTLPRGNVDIKDRKQVYCPAIYQTSSVLSRFEALSLSQSLPISTMMQLQQKPSCPLVLRMAKDSAKYYLHAQDWMKAATREKLLDTLPTAKKDVPGNKSKERRPTSPTKKETPEKRPPSEKSGERKKRKLWKESSPAKTFKTPSPSPKRLSSKSPVSGTAPKTLERSAAARTKSSSPSRSFVNKGNKSPTNRSRPSTAERGSSESQRDRSTPSSTAARTKKGTPNIDARVPHVPRRKSPKLRKPAETTKSTSCESSGRVVVADLTVLSPILEPIKNIGETDSVEFTGNDSEATGQAPFANKQSPAEGGCAAAMPEAQSCSEVSFDTADENCDELEKHDDTQRCAITTDVPSEDTICVLSERNGICESYSGDIKADATSDSTQAVFVNYSEEGPLEVSTDFQSCESDTSKEDIVSSDSKTKANKKQLYQALQGFKTGVLGDIQEVSSPSEDSQREDSRQESNVVLVQKPTYTKESLKTILQQFMLVEKSLEESSPCNGVEESSDENRENSESDNNACTSSNEKMGNNTSGFCSLANESSTSAVANNETHYRHSESCELEPSTAENFHYSSYLAYMVDPEEGVGVPKGADTDFTVMHVQTGAVPFSAQRHQVRSRRPLTPVLEQDHVSEFKNIHFENIGDFVARPGLKSHSFKKEEEQCENTKTDTGVTAEGTKNKEKEERTSERNCEISPFLTKSANIVDRIRKLHQFNALTDMQMSDFMKSLISDQTTGQLQMDQFLKNISSRTLLSRRDSSCQEAFLRLKSSLSKLSVATNQSESQGNFLFRKKISDGKGSRDSSSDSNCWMTELITEAPRSSTILPIMNIVGPQGALNHGEGSIINSENIEGSPTEVKITNTSLATLPPSSLASKNCILGVQRSRNDLREDVQQKSTKTFVISQIMSGFQVSDPRTDEVESTQVMSETKIMTWTDDAPVLSQTSVSFCTDEKDIAAQIEIAQENIANAFGHVSREHSTATSNGNDENASQKTREMACQTSDYSLSIKKESDRRGSAKFSSKVTTVPLRTKACSTTVIKDKVWPTGSQNDDMAPREAIQQQEQPPMLGKSKSHNIEKPQNTEIKTRNPPRIGGLVRNNQVRRKQTDTRKPGVPVSGGSDGASSRSKLRSKIPACNKSYKLKKPPFNPVQRIARPKAPTENDSRDGSSNFPTDMDKYRNTPIGQVPPKQLLREVGAKYNRVTSPRNPNPLNFEHRSGTTSQAVHQRVENLRKMNDDEILEAAPSLNPDQKSSRASSTPPSRKDNCTRVETLSPAESKQLLRKSRAQPSVTDLAAKRNEKKMNVASNIAASPISNTYKKSSSVSQLKNSTAPTVSRSKVGLLSTTSTHNLSVKNSTSRTKLLTDKAPSRMTLKNQKAGEKQATPQTKPGLRRGNSSALSRNQSKMSFKLEPIPGSPTRDDVECLCDQNDTARPASRARENVPGLPPCGNIHQSANGSQRQEENIEVSHEEGEKQVEGSISGMNDITEPAADVCKASEPCDTKQAMIAVEHPSSIQERTNERHEQREPDLLQEQPNPPAKSFHNNARDFEADRCRRAADENMPRYTSNRESSVGSQRTYHPQDEENQGPMKQGPRVERLRDSYQYHSPRQYIVDPYPYHSNVPQRKHFDPRDEYDEYLHGPMPVRSPWQPDDEREYYRPYDYMRGPPAPMMPDPCFDRAGNPVWPQPMPRRVYGYPYSERERVSQVSNERRPRTPPAYDDNPPFHAGPYQVPVRERVRNYQEHAYRKDGPPGRRPSYPPPYPDEDEEDVRSHYRHGNSWHPESGRTQQDNPYQEADCKRQPQQLKTPEEDNLD